MEQSPPLLRLLGVQWVETHKDAIEAHGAAYHSAVWLPLVAQLQAQLPDGGSDRARAAAKERIRQVTGQLEALYAAQSQWLVPEPELRASVKRVIVQVRTAGAGGRPWRPRDFAKYLRPVNAAESKPFLSIDCLFGRIVH